MVKQFNTTQTVQYTLESLARQKNVINCVNSMSYEDGKFTHEKRVNIKLCANSHKLSESPPSKD